MHSSTRPDSSATSLVLDTVMNFRHCVKRFAISQYFAIESRSRARSVN